MKRVICIALAVIMMLSSPTHLLAVEAVLPQKTYTRSGLRSVDEALAWVKSLEGQVYDYDKAFGAQCVDLIKGYYEYLGVPVVRGDGCDYATNAFPEEYGWQRIKNGVPQKGDILIYSGNKTNPYGHVAIYEGKKTIWHGKYADIGIVQKTTTLAYDKYKNPYWGLIRPKFSDNDFVHVTETVKKYKITYKLNGGTNHAKNPATYTKKSKTIILQKPTRKGYTFKGWYSDSKYKKEVTKIKKGSTEKKTLYAKWQKKKYTITYELQGGKNNKNNPKSYYITTATKKLQKPTRKGYTFKGWYSDAKYKNKVTQIKKGSTGNKTLYAKWVKK